MDKIEKILKDHKDKQVTRKKLLADIEPLKKREDEARTAAQVAAEEGNLTGYKEKKRIAEDAADLKHVKEAQLTRYPEKIPEAEALSAWEGYIADETKTIRSKRKNIESAKTAFVTALRDLVSAGESILEAKQSLIDNAAINVDMLRFTEVTMDEINKDINVAVRFELLNDKEATQARQVFMKLIGLIVLSPRDYFL